MHVTSGSLRSPKTRVQKMCVRDVKPSVRPREARAGNVSACVGRHLVVSGATSLQAKEQTSQALGRFPLEHHQFLFYLLINFIYLF